MEVYCLLLLAISPLISAEAPIETPASTVELAKHGNEEDYDCIIYVNDKHNESVAPTDKLMTDIQAALDEIGKKMTNIEAKAGIYASEKFPGKALIYSPTGPLNDDIADSRSISNAGRAGAELAAKSGKKKKLLLVVGPMKTAPADAPWAAAHLKALNAVLGVFYGLYVPLQYREAHKADAAKYASLLVHSEENKDLDWVVTHARAIEHGRVIARDLCGADPERITPTAFVKYTQDMLNGKVEVTPEDINDKYPMIAMVQRASINISRFEGKVLKLDYTNPSAEKSLYLLGLGNTYDTGGADLRVSGTMVGMSRRKCGAAAVVGLMVTAKELQAPINLHGRLAIVRNNIGSKSFTCDTIIKAKSGKRIRIGFTQADGRMILADLLYHARTEASNDPTKHAHIFTVATLTTHVIKAYKYMVGIMDNGPAAKEKTAEQLQLAGDKVADIGEISVIRKEDYDFNLNTLETEDLVQSTNGADDGTKRGHQIAFAFMVQASGLTENGLDAKGQNKQLSYTHLDVSGSAGVLDIVPTASPLAMLTMQYLVKEPGAQSAHGIKL